METNTDQPIAFKIGRSYATRSAVDHDTVFTFTVIARTRKFLTLDCGHGETRRCGVTIWNGIESATPFGRYSMCPVIKADRELA